MMSRPEHVLFHGRIADCNHVDSIEANFSAGDGKKHSGGGITALASRPCNLVRMQSQAMTLADIHAAREVVYRTLQPTPLLRHALLDAETGLDVRVKHENHNPTGAFKVRGGLNLIARLPARDRRGVITATTGNHGQSIAMACQREGVPCTIVVPLGNNPEKNAAMRALGASVVEVGRDFDEAREHIEHVNSDNTLRYVHSANEPHLVAGVATYALEIFEQAPDVDVVLVPIGGGSGACGCALVRTLVGSRAEVIGVQAAGADAFARSWRTGTRVVGAAADTFAEGMATRVTFDFTFGILRELLDDVVTLTEAELMEGVRLALRATHNLAEGAGAASLAAAVKLRGRLAGRKVVCVMSGGNIDQATLARVLASGAHDLRLDPTA
jgi:threonine dehydratase